MNNIEALFHKKLQELKNRPHKRFDNNEVDAAQSDFITSDVLQKSSARFSAFLTSYKHLKEGDAETKIASLF